MDTKRLETKRSYENCQDYLTGRQYTEGQGIQWNKESTEIKMKQQPVVAENV